MFQHVCLKEGYNIIFKTSGMGRAVKKAPSNNPERKKLRNGL